MRVAAALAASNVVVAGLVDFHFIVSGHVASDGITKRCPALHIEGVNVVDSSNEDDSFIFLSNSGNVTESILSVAQSIKSPLGARSLRLVVLSGIGTDHSGLSTNFAMSVTVTLAAGVCPKFLILYWTSQALSRLERLNHAFSMKT